MVLSGSTKSLLTRGWLRHNPVYERSMENFPQGLRQKNVCGPATDLGTESIRCQQPNQDQAEELKRPGMEERQIFDVRVRT